MPLSALGVNGKEPIPPMVSAFTRGWGFMSEGVAGTPGTNNTWAVGNTGLYFPIFVPTTCIATRMWWANGSVTSGNTEAAIYHDTGDAKPGTRLAATGSVAQSGTTSIQFAEFSPSADHRLDPGLWWLWLSASTASAFYYESLGATSAWDEMFGFKEAAAPGSAPSVATPLETDWNVVPYVGFSTNTVT